MTVCNETPGDTAHTEKMKCESTQNPTMNLYEIKCHKALWLQAREAVWSNCKRTQSSVPRFFLCKKYKLLLRSLRTKYYKIVIDSTKTLQIMVSHVRIENVEKLYKNINMN